MKSYLRRLAERAEGVSLTPPLRPAMRSEVVREAGADSIVDRAGESSLQTSKPSEDVAQYQPLHDSSRRVEPSVQVSPRVGMGRPQSSELGETRPGPAPIIQPRSAGKETATPQHLEPRREIVFPQRTIIKARSLERKPAPPIEVQQETSAGKNSPPLTLQRYVDEPFPKERRGNMDEGHRSDQLTQDVRQGLLSPSQPIERLAPTPKEIGAAVNDHAIPNLEPPRAEPIRQVTPISNEPRLVIGQLRVDILPAGPTETREVVRIVQRSAGASRTLRASPVSKLRFGLGQM
jgi:hypothetical protein